MTFAASTTTGWTPEQTNTQLPAGDTFPEQVNTAATAPGLGQTVYFDGNGNVAGNDGTVPLLVSGGTAYPEKQAPISTVAGAGLANVHQGFGGGVPASAAAGDSFLASDRGVVAWEAGNGTPGKLPVLSGNDRSIFGIVLGLRPDGTPRTWTGIIASIVARALHLAQNESAGNISYAVDASATTDLYSASVPAILPRASRRGVIKGIQIIPTAALAATSGSNATITIVKVDTTGAVALASSPTVATFTTTTALVAGIPAQFTLSATPANLILRTTDRLGWYRTHASSGAVIPLSAIESLFQVI